MPAEALLILRDLKLPRELPAGFDVSAYLRLLGELLTAEEGHGDDASPPALAIFWRQAGSAIVAELGPTRAKRLRSWRAFGDPAGPLTMPRTALRPAPLSASIVRRLRKIR